MVTYLFRTVKTRLDYGNHPHPSLTINQSGSEAGMGCRSNSSLNHCGGQSILLFAFVIESLCECEECGHFAFRE